MWGCPSRFLSAQEGFQTTGFDNDPRKIEKLGRGESYIQHISAESISAATRQGKRFQATSDFAPLKGMDAIIICVPTPLDKHREPDLSFVRNTAEVVGGAPLQRGPTDRTGKHDLPWNYGRRNAVHSREIRFKVPCFAVFGRG